MRNALRFNDIEKTVVRVLNICVSGISRRRFWMKCKRKNMSKKKNLITRKNIESVCLRLGRRGNVLLYHSMRPSYYLTYVQVRQTTCPTSRFQSRPRSRFANRIRLRLWRCNPRQACVRSSTRPAHVASYLFRVVCLVCVCLIWIRQHTWVFF